MNSHQLLERAPDQLRRAPAPAIRELEPAPASAQPSDTLRRDSHYRHLLLIGDMLACGLGLVAATLLGKTTHLTIQSIVLVLLAPAVAKILGLYDRDQARLRKSTLDELPALLQLAGLISFLALTLAPVVFDGILGPREAIGLFVVLFAGLTVGRAAARRLAGELTPAERCLFIGPVEEAIRFREKIERDHATNAKLVAQIEIDNASPWAAPAVAEHSLADARELRAPLRDSAGDHRAANLRRRRHARPDAHVRGHRRARERDSGDAPGGRIGRRVRRRARRGCARRAARSACHGPRGW